MALLYQHVVSIIYNLVGYISIMNHGPWLTISNHFSNTIWYSKTAMENCHLLSLQLTSLTSLFGILWDCDIPHLFHAFSMCLSNWSSFTNLNKGHWRGCFPYKNQWFQCSVAMRSLYFTQIHVSYLIYTWLTIIIDSWQKISNTLW